MLNRVNADNHQDGCGQRCPPVDERLEIERLDRVRDELQVEYERLYIDHKNLHRQYEKVVENAKQLESDYFGMDNRTYRKRWRNLYEEEVALQELGATIRQYAEKVREKREKVWLVRERLIKDSAAC